MTLAAARGLALSAERYRQRHKFIILKFTVMEKAIKKAKLLGNTGMVLVIIGLTGLASISDWQNFYMFVLAIAAVMLVLSNAILTDIHKNIK